MDNMQANHKQMDDIKDAIDIVSLIEAAVEIYPKVVDCSGVTSGAQDVIAEIACDRHPREAVARFSEDPKAFVESGDMVDIGPISASSFAVLVSALETVASAGHALDVMNGKRV
jgi:hypothetical protein